MTSAANAGSGGAPAPPVSRSSGLLWLFFRLGALALIDAITIFLVYNFLLDGVVSLAVVLALIAIFLNVVFLREELYPLRWISPGMALLILIVIYPIFFTVYISFTNYGDGHLLTKPVVVEQIENRTYLPEDAQVYDWTAYLSPTGEYLLWLQDPGADEAYIARPEQEVEPVTGEPPTEIDGYTQLDKIQRLQHTAALTAMRFGVPPLQFRVSDKQIGKAAQYEPQYLYDDARDVMIDQQTGVEYAPFEGTFTAADGSTLRPGWSVPLGTDNYMRLFTDPSLRGPFIQVFVWTVMFAVLSVILTFSLGLFLAIVFNVDEMPFRSVLRSLLLIPYTLPAFVAVPVWVGLLNPQYGIVSQWIAVVFGSAPPWFTDPTWSRIGVLFIQLWLGFPYMFVISTGALQALPKDIYKAAEIDGANAWQQFRSITFPLIMITMGPLLVASFAFNFNNFAIIDLFNEGGPPMANTASPVGWTDILVTYTYRIAFSSGRGADYGYASAITVVIFLILVVITFFQFRFTNMLEEQSENV